jgi:hypothetical protein
VAVGPQLRYTGWTGGIFVKYIDPGLNPSDWIVERTDGNGTCGFLAFPSENYNFPPAGATQNYTGIDLRTEQGSASGANTVALFVDCGRYLFTHYEKIALRPDGVRAGGPAIFHLNEYLYVSENGLLCNDPIPFLQAAGVANPCLVGLCSYVPAARNAFRLGIDYSWY